VPVNPVILQHASIALQLPILARHAPILTFYLEIHAWQYVPILTMEITIFVLLVLTTVIIVPIKFIAYPASPLFL
jgi:hypothetical protein